MTIAAVQENDSASAKPIPVLYTVDNEYAQL